MLRYRGTSHVTDNLRWSPLNRISAVNQSGANVFTLDHSPDIRGFPAIVLNHQSVNPPSYNGPVSREPLATISIRSGRATRLAWSNFVESPTESQSPPAYSALLSVAIDGSVDIFRVCLQISQDDPKVFLVQAPLIRQSLEADKRPVTTLTYILDGDKPLLVVAKDYSIGLIPLPTLQSTEDLTWELSPVALHTLPYVGMIAVERLLHIFSSDGQYYALRLEKTDLSTPHPHTSWSLLPCETLTRRNSQTITTYIRGVYQMFHGSTATESHDDNNDQKGEADEDDLMDDGEAANNMKIIFWGAAMSPHGDYIALCLNIWRPHDTYIFRTINYSYLLMINIDQNFRGLGNTMGQLSRRLADPQVPARSIWDTCQYVIDAYQCAVLNQRATEPNPQFFWKPEDVSQFLSEALDYPLLAERLDEEPNLQLGLTIPSGSSTACGTAEADLSTWWQTAIWMHFLHDPAVKCQQKTNAIWHAGRTIPWFQDLLAARAATSRRHIQLHWLSLVLQLFQSVRTRCPDRLLRDAERQWLTTSIRLARQFLPTHPSLPALQAWVDSLSFSSPSFLPSSSSPMAETAATSSERCPLCLAEILSKAELDRAECPNGHSSARCFLTFTLIDTPTNQSCRTCTAKRLCPPSLESSPSALQGSLLDWTLQCTPSCILCDSALYQKFPGLHLKVTNGP
ncbi:hypothetical protein H4R33_001371 [Dimargaris cristalligena]|nr:hypothetical protein H4R33_001371 [Dimargaris cristalligena]